MYGKSGSAQIYIKAKKKLLQQPESFHYPQNYMSGRCRVIGQDDI